MRRVAMLVRTIVWRLKMRKLDKSDPYLYK